MKLFQQLRKQLPDRNLIGNVSYIAILQVFNIFAPLITYPYLVNVLGMDLYGVVITAQILVGYFSIFILLGTDGVCAKHISINRDNQEKLSGIFSAILFLRAIIWLLGLVFYVLLLCMIPQYKNNFWIFIISYGITFHELLFPQYLFQGLEKMKFTTIVNVIAKLFFILLVFILVKSQDDVLYVPFLYSCGFLAGGVAAIVIVLKSLNIKLVKADISQIKSLAKESFPIFASDLIMTIKDRFNVLLMGNFIGMSNVVIYDFAMKINLFLVKPSEIIRIALFPRAAKSRSIRLAEKTMLIVFLLTIGMVVVVNIFLKDIVSVFLNSEFDLLPIRLFTLAPLILSCSAVIQSNVFTAFGYNRYVLNSIICTTICYLMALLFCLVSHSLTTVNSFILISLFAYTSELAYRAFKYRNVVKMESIR